MKMTKTRLWRVDVINKVGTQAPYLMVETQSYLKYEAETEAIKLAKERTRLSDFSKTWNFIPSCTDKMLYNGKWLTREEVEYKRDCLKGNKG